MAEVQEKEEADCKEDKLSTIPELDGHQAKWKKAKNKLRADIKVLSFTGSLGSSAGSVAVRSMLEPEVIQVTGGGAAVIEQDLFEAWTQSEDSQPTDPYKVLGVPYFCTQETVDKRFLQVMQMYEEAESHGVQGALPVLKGRLQRSYELLSDANTRKAHLEHRKEQVKQKKWTKLRYANGLYEGSVDPASMEEGSEAMRSGKGMTILSSGEKHEGEYVDGKKHGIGLQFWKNGDLYLGQFQQDKMAGKGCYYYGSGAQYVGEFLDGRRHGVGVHVWPDGSMYDGSFADGQRSGYGVLHLPGETDGTSCGYYAGQWRDGDFEGEGVFSSDLFGFYEGQFQASSFHGQGKQELPQGDMFEGTFMQGKRDGNGVYQWPNGDVYEGAIRGNQRSGKGTFSSPSQKLVFLGQWQADLPQGNGKLKQEIPAGEAAHDVEGVLVYKGQWDNGKRSGHGILAWPSGSRYTGHFAKDKKHGTGLCEWADGSSFDGIFVRDLRDGAGIFRKPAQGEDQTPLEQLEIWRKGDLVNHEKREPKLRLKDQPASFNDSIGSQGSSRSKKSSQKPDKKLSRSKNLSKKQLQPPSSAKSASHTSSR